jgi:hypothetical protein
MPRPPLGPPGPSGPLLLPGSIERRVQAIPIASKPEGVPSSFFSGRDGAGASPRRPAPTGPHRNRLLVWYIGRAAGRRPNGFPESRKHEQQDDAVTKPTYTGSPRRPLPGRTSMRIWAWRRRRIDRDRYAGMEMLRLLAIGTIPLLLFGLSYSIVLPSAPTSIGNFPVD